MTEVRVVTREQLVERLTALLSDYGMTIDEFRAEGEADTLTDGRLRDAWLSYWPRLFND